MAQHIIALELRGVDFSTGKRPSEKAFKAFRCKPDYQAVRQGREIRVVPPGDGMQDIAREAVESSPDVIPLYSKREIRAVLAEYDANATDVYAVEDEQLYRVSLETDAEKKRVARDLTQDMSRQEQLKTLYDAGVLGIRKRKQR